MKYLVKEPCELEIIESIDQHDEIDSSTTETFQVGEVVEFDIFEHCNKWSNEEVKFVEDKNIANIQFGDGSISIGVSLEWFEEQGE